MNDFYPDMVDLLTKDMEKNVRLALKGLLLRTADLFKIQGPGENKSVFSSMKDSS